MRYYRHKILLSILSCMVLLLFGVSRAGAQSDHTARLIEGAKKEGKLVWYTAMGVSESRPLLDAFEMKYPFVRAELFRASGERILNKIMTETRAESWQFDVVSSSSMNILMQHKAVSLYVSPEAQAYIQEFKDSEGHWTGLYTNYYVVGYNTHLVPKNEAPKQWEDLLDPKWRGKVAIDVEEYEWYAGLLTAWGREKTQDYMRRLAKQQVQWRKGHTLIAQLLAAGEFPLAIVYAHTVESMKKKGAPIEWANSLDPVVAKVIGVSLGARPNNPNAARLFIDFVLSKEGQQMIRSFDRIPPRSDVEPLSPRMDQAKIKLQMVPKDMETRYNEYVREFRSVFGL